MTLTFDWFLPTSGDGRTIIGRGHSLPLGAASGAGGASGASAALTERPPDIEYLAQVAKAAEQVGFEAVLTPTGTWCEDAWLATAALIGQTSRPAGAPGPAGRRRRLLGLLLLPVVKRFAGPGAARLACSHAS